MALKKGADDSLEKSSEFGCLEGERAKNSKHSKVPVCLNQGDVRGAKVYPPAKCG